MQKINTKIITFLFSAGLLAAISNQLRVLPTKTEETETRVVVPSHSATLSREHPSSEVQRRVRQIMFEDKISEQELMAYYQAHPDQFGGPFQEVIPSIEALVRIERARALLANEPSQ